MKKAWRRLTSEEMSKVTGGNAVCIDPNGCKSSGSWYDGLVDAAVGFVLCAMNPFSVC
jgi:hypothetical protein